MNRQYVASSSIASAGYERATATLEIEFVGGAVYQYDDVPFCIFQALLAADSKGLFVNQHIRNVYRYTRKAERNK